MADSYLFKTSLSREFALNAAVQVLHNGAMGQKERFVIHAVRWFHVIAIAIIPS